MQFFQPGALEGDVIAGVDPLATQGVQLAAQVDDLAAGVGGGLLILGALSDLSRDEAAGADEGDQETGGDQRDAAHMPMNALIPMIGRARQDGDGAIDLFGQHGAGQGVRPGLGSEGQHLVGR